MGTHQLPVLNNKDTFEDAICELFNSLESTNTFKRFGRNGHKQKGIDIFSPDKDFVIQCKKKDLSRKEISLKKELLDEIEADVNRVINQNLKIKFKRLYFTSTFKDHPDIDEYCEALKDELRVEFEIIYWGWDTLESKFLGNKKLIEKYWPNFVITQNSREDELKFKVSLKKQIEKDFGDWLKYAPENRKRNSKMILRAFDSSQYPESNEPDEHGEYSWFGAEIKSLYHKGMEFVIGIKNIQVFDDYSWDFITEAKPTGKVIKVAKVGQINFSNIVEYDIKGDEYYICPHIYCKFIYKGSPFENVYYYDLEKTYDCFELKDKRERSDKK
jgi:hypothetical protein